MEENMNYLIIYGHPNSKSFNNAIKETLENALKEKGEVVVRDLYSMNFDLTSTADEYLSNMYKHEKKKSGLNI